ncbi:MAG: UvrB/UvrC motif-containing protein, partial [Aeromonas sp.]
EETERRRTLQHEHNLKHGIGPKGLNKKIMDVMDTGGESSNRASGRKAAEPEAPYHHHSPGEIAREIKRLEEQMFEHARNLEFEQAAALRDQVAKLREALLES